MTVFWIVAALFLLGAVLMTLPPLLRRQQPAASGAGANLAVHRDQLLEAERDLADDLITPERFAQAQAEIHRRVLEDTSAVATRALAERPARLTLIALALAIPLGSVLTYLALGRPQAAAPQVSPAPIAATAAGNPNRQGVTREQIENMVTALAERVKAEPANAENLLMLGRSYATLGRYRDAAIAMRRANGLAPGNAGLLADLADLVGMTQAKRLAGEPARLVQQALAIDPGHPKALALAGSVAFEARDYVAALVYWERLVAVLPTDSPMVRPVRASIAEATALAGASTPVATAAASPATTGVRAPTDRVPP